MPLAPLGAPQLPLGSPKILSVPVPGVPDPSVPSGCPHVPARCSLVSPCPPPVSQPSGRVSSGDPVSPHALFCLPVALSPWPCPRVTPLSPPVPGRPQCWLSPGCHPACPRWRRWQWVTPGGPVAPATRPRGLAATRGTGGSPLSPMGASCPLWVPHVTRGCPLSPWVPAATCGTLLSPRVPHCPHGCRIVPIIVPLPPQVPIVPMGACCHPWVLIVPWDTCCHLWYLLVPMGVLLSPQLSHCPHGCSVVPAGAHCPHGCSLSPRGAHHPPGYLLSPWVPVVPRGPCCHLRCLMPPHCPVGALCLIPLAAWCPPGARGPPWVPGAPPHARCPPGCPVSPGCPV